MPELRRGVRRGRAKVAHKRSEPPVGNYVKTRAAVARAKKLKLEKEEEHQQVIVISERDSGSERKKGKKVVGKEEKGPMADDSGGLSANKAAGQEEEGSTAPFPEKVCAFLMVDFCCFVNWVCVVVAKNGFYGGSIDFFGVL
jgi:hypothetical protein